MILNSLQMIQYFLSCPSFTYNIWGYQYIFFEVCWLPMACRFTSCISRSFWGISKAISKMLSYAFKKKNKYLWTDLNPFDWEHLGTSCSILQLRSCVADSKTTASPDLPGLHHQHLFLAHFRWQIAVGTRKRHGSVQHRCSNHASGENTVTIKNRFMVFSTPHCFSIALSLEGRIQ